MKHNELIKLWDIVVNNISDPVVKVKAIDIIEKEIVAIDEELINFMASAMSPIIPAHCVTSWNSWPGLHTLASRALHALRETHNITPKD